MVESTAALAADDSGTFLYTVSLTEFSSSAATVTHKQNTNANAHGNIDVCIPC